jgi:hypothetical protein
MRKLCLQIMFLGLVILPMLLFASLPQSVSIPANKVNAVVFPGLNINTNIGTQRKVKITFNTNGATATALKVDLSKLPANWSVQNNIGNTFTCANVTNAGNACSLNLSFTPVSNTDSGTLNLPYSYTNDKGKVQNATTLAFNYKAVAQGMFVTSVQEVSYCTFGATRSCSSVYKKARAIFTDITAYQGRAYIVDHYLNEIDICDITSNSSRISFTNCKASTGFAYPFNIAIHNHYAYITSNQGSVRYCRINADGSLKTPCQSYDINGTKALKGIAIDNNRAYIADATYDSIYICQIQSKSNPALANCTRFRDSKHIINWPNGISISNGYVHVVSFSTAQVASCPIDEININSGSGVCMASEGQPGDNGIAAYSDTDNAYAYVANEKSGNISQCTFGKNNNLVNCKAYTSFTAPSGIGLY